jgi:DNA-binding transcriptional LysR family regulator
LFDDNRFMERIDAAMDLAQLQAFYEVARAGSVRKAATALHRSQPAVSHRLRALQDDLGQELFEKVGRGLQLTPVGRRLFERCGELFAFTRALRASLPGTGEVVGRVEVGTLPTVASHLLAEELAQLLARHPKLELSFVFDVFPEVLEALRGGRVDLAVVVGEVDATGLRAQRLGDTGLVAVMARSAVPAGRSLKASALKARRLLAWDGPPDPTFALVQQFVARHGLRTEATARIPHIETLRRLAAAGAGYAILPEYTVGADVAAGLLAARPLEGLTARIPITLLSRPTQLFTPALEAVREAFVQAGARGGAAQSKRRMSQR